MSEWSFAYAGKLSCRDGCKVGTLLLKVFGFLLVLSLITHSYRVHTHGPQTKHAQRVCAQAPDRGPCRGKFERYFYNFRKGRCEIFIYGGCLGNQNNFLTEKECLQRCLPY
uniref:BPTI/Kunitz inhibitor domain-containing protein n=1 Tax=Oryzias latipes TaxID=8090 RepID=A0A3P9KSI1_ORYLA